MDRNFPPKSLTVCVYSSHPLVLEQFQHLLGGTEMRLEPRRFDSFSMTGAASAAIPSAGVYVVDVGATPAGDQVVNAILEQHPTAPVIVVGEQFSEEVSFKLLRIGIKGLLPYSDAEAQLSRAIAALSGGGYWVPRQVLGSFVNSILRERGRYPVPAGTYVSSREQQVLTELLNNLSNKEIASKLNISERTVKFHVSNLLQKFGVQRRADLIVLWFQTAGKTQNHMLPVVM